MKIKVLGFALLLGLASVLGACNEGGGEGTGTTTTTPAAGEPADGAASPTATTTPAATPTKAP